MTMILRQVRVTWPYFLPTWLHAVLLPLIISWLISWLSPLCRNSENWYALLYTLSFGVWLFALIPIRKRLVTVSHAIVFILLPYVPFVLISIATMRD